jgi:selenocysteine lyase/cysteine desulfurase
MDISRPLDALRNSNGECSANRSYGPRKLAMEKKKIRIRGADPNKLRLSTPYYLSKQDIDRFLDAFDEYKKSKA